MSETGSDTTPTDDSTSDSDPDYVCRKCREPVQPGAQHCPECGYKAMGHRYNQRGNYYATKIVKWVAYVTVILIPLGLWLRREEDKYEQALELGVAEPVEE